MLQVFLLCIFEMMEKINVKKELACVGLLYL